MADSLRSLGATHVFGNPGTTELPLVDAIVESELRYVTCLHEDIALGAAAGFATRARQLAEDLASSVPLAVANLHATPGVAHGLGNLYGASFARAPVLVTAGCQGPRHERRRPPLSGQRLALVDDIVKDTQSVHDADHLPDAVVSAARTALRPPTGPVYLELPMEVQDAQTDASTPALGALPTPGAPDEEAVGTVAEIVGAQADITMVVGDELGRAGATTVRQAARLAEQLDAAVYAEPLNGELDFPTDHPNWVGMLPLDPEQVRAAYGGDAVVFLGCTRPEPLLDYEPPLWEPSTTAVWIGTQPGDVPQEPSFAAVLTGALEPAIRGLLSDVTAVVAADGSGVAKARQAHIDELTTADRGQRQAEIDAKVRLAHAFARASEEAVIIDEGVTTGILLRSLATLPLGRFIAQCSGGLGYGLPAAVGAAIAEDTYADDPRPTVGLIGDGTYQYYPQTLYTAIRHVDTPLTIVVPDNAGYGILRDRGVIDESDPDEQPLTFDHVVSVEQNAASYGARTRTLRGVEGVEPAIREAIEAGGTEVIVVDIRGVGKD